jgi:hypothetical protein
VDATARLYDVNEDSLVFERLDYKKKYDQGTITFHARKGKLIDLDKLRESIWATRLSGGTHSGLVSFEVTVIGKIVPTKAGLVLRVRGSRDEFPLGEHTDKKYRAAYSKLKAIGPNRVVRLTGLIDGYRGRWPTLLKQPSAKSRKILVTHFKVVE